MSLCSSTVAKEHRIHGGCGAHIGANTDIFTRAIAVLLKSLPVPIPSSRSWSGTAADSPRIRVFPAHISGHALSNAAAGHPGCDDMARRRRPIGGSAGLEEVPPNRVELRLKAGRSWFDLNSVYSKTGQGRQAREAFDGRNWL